MENSSFELEEVESERTVILSEKEGNENSPLYRLGEAVQNAAFEVHPYQNSIIGEYEDLKQIQLDDLCEHYREYYVPENALISVAGDFETKIILDRLKELYIDIEPGGSVSRTGNPEVLL